MLKDAQTAKLRKSLERTPAVLPKLFNALSDQSRYRIVLLLLENKDLCVTDVAKVLSMNCNAGVFGLAMGFALGGIVRAGRLSFDASPGAEELSDAGKNWIEATVQETAIIARCTGKTDIHNLEPEDLRSITIATVSGSRVQQYANIAASV